ncbi:nuclear transport factor 2 family protein [Arthrobacter sp. TMT4-20]
MAPLDIVRNHYVAAREGDFDRAFAAISESTKWTEAAGSAYAGTFIGPEAIMANVFTRIGADWAGFELQELEFFPSGDRVLCTGWYAGTSVATGISMRARFVHLWEVEGDRLASFEQVVDSAAQNAAMA